MSKTTTPTLTHAEWCSGERTETTEHADSGITTTRCVDCAAHQATDARGNLHSAPHVAGAMHGRGRGDMDVDMRPATPADVWGR